MIKDNQIFFDYLFNDKETQNTRLGKGKFIPYVAQGVSVNNKTIYSVYNKNVKTISEIIKTLKKQNKIDMNSSDYEHFIKRTAVYVTSESAGIMKNIDVILTPKSSSFIVQDLVDEIKKRKPDIKIITETFYKLPVEDIVIDYKNYDVSETVKTDMDKLIKKAKKEGFLELKKVKKIFLNYISNILCIDKLKIKQNYIENKNILLIDDVLSSGKTFQEMIRLIESFSPNEIRGLTIFKT